MPETEQRLRDELYAAFKNRALVYHHLYQELKRDLGEERAADLMKRGIYERGLTVGRRFANVPRGDFRALKDAFVSNVPDGGAMFSPQVRRCDVGGLELKLTRCPLKEAWLESGLPDGEVAKLCEIAAQVDYGTFEAAGYAVTVETWLPGRDGCCHLYISEEQDAKVAGARTQNREET